MRDADTVLRSAEAAFREQQAHISNWREACDYSLPGMIYQVGGNGQSYYRTNSDLVNDTAVQARRDLSSGMSNAFINAGEMWFEYQPSKLLPKNSQKRAAQWLAECTQIVWEMLPGAGFYDQATMALDHGVTVGTAAYKTEGEIEGSESPLNCSVLDIGSYAIAENSAKKVDQLWHEIEYTVAQAETAWPEYRNPKWQLLPPETKLTQKEIFIFEVRPRDRKEVQKGMGNHHMPFEGTIVHKQDKQIVWRGGWRVFPFTVWRYDRQASTTPWGIGPGIQALPSIRGVNYLDSSVADGIDKMSNPPVAVKSDIRGTVDLRSRGVTLVENLNDRPQAIYEVGNQQIGMAFLQQKEQAVRRWFHSDLFAFFLNDDRFKTATVALQIAAEKLGLFASFGYRFMNEWVEPTLERIFKTLFYAGKFPKAPPECLVFTRDGWDLAFPKVVQQSRMALALREMRRQDARQFFTDIMPLLQIAPEQVGRFNFDVVAKIFGANEVTMPGLMKSDEEFEAYLEQQREAAMKAEAMKLGGQFAVKNPELALAATGAAAA